MCQPGTNRGRHGADSCLCGCCVYGSSTFKRRFVSAKEQQERMEEYKDQLTKEIAAVEDRINELKVE